MQVFIRLRPPFQNEINDPIFDPMNMGHQNQWQCAYLDPQDPTFIQLNIPKESPKEYQFDEVFNDEVSQSSIFQQTCLPLVMNVLNGYNGTYFVYGQTGTGKTHTMGVLNNINTRSEGIIPQSVDYIIKFLQE